jgi:hypothetical protein
MNTDASSWPWWPGCFALRSKPNASEMWRTSVWWRLVNRTESAHLLFGWAFKWNREPPICSRWTCFKIPHGNTTIVRCVLDASFSDTMKIVDALARGQSLGEASHDAGIDLSPDVPSFVTFGNVLLENEAHSASVTYDMAASPWRLLPSRGGDHSLTLASPLEDAPAMRCALVRLDKVSLLPDDIDAARELLRDVELETGLSVVPNQGITGRDLYRLGDFEILVFRHQLEGPSGVDVDVVHGELVVCVDPSITPAWCDMFIHCRQTHAGAVLREDAVFVRRREEGGGRAAFPVCPVGASGAIVAIWVSEGDSGEFSLAFEHEFAWIRQIGFRIDIDSEPEVRIKTKWIEDWSLRHGNSHSRRIRATNVSRVSHAGMGSLATVGASDQTWELAERSASRLLEQLQPAKCSALWVSKISADPRAEGKVRVAEWIKETFATSSPRVLLIVDPYFDGFGFDILVLLGSSVRRVTVVTSLKASERDKRTRLLQDEYRRRRHLLQSLRVEVFGVQRKKLHDRYIIELDGSGDPIKGFCLSNSLGSATVDNNILVTEIPLRVLSDVVASVAQATTEVQEILSQNGLYQRSPRGKLEPLSDADLVRHWAHVESCLKESPDEFSEVYQEFSLRVASSTSDIGRWARTTAMSWADPEAIVARIREYICGQCSIEVEANSGAKMACGIAQMSPWSFGGLASGPRFWQRPFDAHPDWGVVCGWHLLYSASEVDFVGVYTTACQKACEAAKVGDMQAQVSADLWWLLRVKSCVILSRLTEIGFDVPSF